MTPMIAKLLVKFDKNVANTTKFVDDSSNTLKEIKSSVEFVSYVGIYESEYTFNIYVQLQSGKRVVPSTFSKKLSHLGNIIYDPEKFRIPEGILIKSSGDFVKNGRKTGAKVINGRVVMAQLNPPPPAQPNPPPPKKSVMNLAVLARAYRAHVQRKAEEQMIADNETKFAPLYTGYGNNWGICGWVQIGVVGVRKKVKPREKDFLYESQNGKCVFCETVVPEDYSNSDVDHIIPLSLGGTCEMDNLQILCIRCHRKKTGFESRRIKKSTKELVLHKSM